MTRNVLVWKLSSRTITPECRIYAGGLLYEQEFAMLWLDVTNALHRHGNPEVRWMAAYHVQKPSHRHIDYDKDDVDQPKTLSQKATFGPTNTRHTFRA